MRLLTWILLLTAIATLSCYPKVPSAKCQSVINECLRTCPEPTGDNSDFVMTGEGSVNTMSDCQRICHDRCKEM